MPVRGLGGRSRPRLKPRPVPADVIGMNVSAAGGAQMAVLKMALDAVQTAPPADAQAAALQAAAAQAPLQSAMAMAGRIDVYA